MIFWGLQLLWIVWLCFGFSYNLALILTHPHDFVSVLVGGFGVMLHLYLLWKTLDD